MADMTGTTFPDRGAAAGRERILIVDDEPNARKGLADVRMPRMDGITLLKRARELGSESVFVMMTAFASIETAVEAMRAGAENYLVKPLDDKAVLVVLERSEEHTSELQSQSN